MTHNHSQKGDFDCRTSDVGEWKGLPFYTRVSIAGLLAYAALFEGIGVLLGALGEPSLVIFASILVVLTLVTVVLARWYGK